VSEQDQFADLRKLLVKPIEETIGGRKLVIRVFDFERLPAVTDLVAKAKQFIVITQEGVVDFDFIGVFQQQHSLAMQLLHELSNGIETEWLGKLPSDEALFLFAIYVRVNADFFVQRLAPLLMTVWSSLALSGFASADPASGNPAESAGAT
jgi:hypothetical protein